MPELAPGVHVVEITPPNFGPGGPMNLCLLVAEGEATLVDAGLPGVSVPLLAYLKEIQLKPEAIQRVIITHHHIDITWEAYQRSLLSAGPKSGRTRQMHR